MVSNSGRIIAGVLGWLDQNYLRERINWYARMRPYMHASVRPYVLTAQAERALKPGATFRECSGDCPEMVVIAAGTFTMGSPATERDRYDGEGPQHIVTLAAPFAVSKYDVTFADWDVCVAVGGCPQVSDSAMGRGARPAINVTWEDAQQYAAWFSMASGRPYRLLTEAEWEYADRAGTTTPYSWGEVSGNNQGNCNACGSAWDNKATSPVGSFKPNAFGLYDMAGNVWQWTQDCYHDNYQGAPTDGLAWTGGDCGAHVVRGGGWPDGPDGLRAAYRDRDNTLDRLSSLGFRVGRTLNP